MHAYYNKNSCKNKEELGCCYCFCAEHCLCYHEYNMSKVANYLNEHILGEVTSDAAARKAFSTDGSVLAMTPEMVVYPRTTNDIRKIARFSNQLAEKGHLLPITVRGGGTDHTGAAIGSGVIVAMAAHMNAIFELDGKQKLVRVQPGAMFKSVNDALRLHGLQIPSYPVSAAYSTIGGAVANNGGGLLSGKYGATGRWVHQLEVVLSNGDVIQTGRVSKRELNRKKGQQNFEGEIYRQIDNLINDNSELIKSAIDPDVRDNAGYSGIADVKRRDGSIDLAPLFIGSQGTLGVISEIIMKAEHIGEISVSAIAFESHNAARDAVDAIKQLGPCLLEYIDATLFDQALERGKKYAFYDDASDKGKVATVLVVGFDEANDRHRHKKQKKLAKIMNNQALYAASAPTLAESQELLVLRGVSHVAVYPDGAGMTAPPLVDGAYVPFARFEDFMTALGEFAAKHHVELPLYGSVLDNVYYVRPALQLSKVGDRQKVFKIIDEYAKLVASHSGHLIGESAEGRLKAPFVYRDFEEGLVKLYQDIRVIFDPNSILNPGVKEKTDLKQLVGMLRADYDESSFANYSPTN